jgi:hypothetical protein
LQFTKTGNLHRDVPRIRHHRGESNDEPQEQARGWGAARRERAKHAPSI